MEGNEKAGGVVEVNEDASGGVEMATARVREEARELRGNVGNVGARHTREYSPTTRGRQRLTCTWRGARDEVVRKVMAAQVI